MLEIYGQEIDLLFFIKEKKNSQNSLTKIFCNYKRSFIYLFTILILFKEHNCRFFGICIYNYKVN